MGNNKEIDPKCGKCWLNEKFTIPQLEATRAREKWIEAKEKTPTATTMHWLAYDAAMFEKGLKLRAKLIQDHKLDEETDQKEFEQHMTDTVHRNYNNTTNNVQRNNTSTAKAYCSLHRNVGDAYPYRDFRKYETSCGICLIESESFAAKVRDGRVRMNAGAKSGQTNFDHKNPAASLERFSLSRHMMD